MAELPVYTRDARGQLVVIYPDGRVIPVLGQEHAGVAPGGSSPAPEPDPITEGTSDSYGYAPRAGYSSDYTPRAPRGFGDGGGPEWPSYGDGSRHPAFGGDPLIPGGQAAARDGRGDDGYASGGWGNLPFIPDQNDSYVKASPVGRGGSGPSTGGGDGGGGSALYYKLRDKLTGGGSSSSSYSSGYSGSSYGQVKEPREPNMRGPYAKGLDPDQAMGLAMRPTAMIPRAMPGLDASSPLYGHLAELPAAQLAMLGKRGYSGSPKALANSLGRFYNAAGNDSDLPEFDTVFRNLSAPKKGGGLDDLFGGIKNPASIRRATGYPYEYGHEPLDAGTAATTYEGLLDAALSLLPNATAAKYSSGSAGIIDKGTLKSMKRPAGKGQSINRYVGRRLFVR